MITRCSGINTGLGHLVGCGYSGITKDLDDIVLKAAELLKEKFNKDIEIRFNSDRYSGGAWVKDDKQNCSVGLGARLSNIKYLTMAEEEKERLAIKDIKNFLNNPDTIVINTAISLNDTENTVNKNSNYIVFDYEYKDFNTLDEAFSYLIENVISIKFE